jgi:precorrin-6A/cobalt-precorrin-6A reductase
MTVLILGGTREARVLAEALDRDGIAVTTSLAGRVPDPRPTPGGSRVGGFGGPDGLAEWLVAHGVEAVVDATHPFAARMSASAVTACERSDVPLLRLERPGWKPGDGDRWHWAADLRAAAAMVPDLGTRVLLTTGHADLAAFAGIGDAWFIVRCITRPPGPLPPRHVLLLERGPFTLEGELALMDGHAIDLVVTKDSGGASGEAKLAAARERGIAVLLVRRPPLPHADTAGSIPAARRWVHGMRAAG